MKEFHVNAEDMCRDIREKCVIDLRKAEDYKKGSCDGAENVYWEDFNERIPGLPKDKPLYLICYTGETSDEYAKHLRSQGYEAYSIHEGYRGYMRWKLRQIMDGEGEAKVDRKKDEVPNREEQKEITRKGNPRKPQGEEGEQMLRRMNESHSAVTKWALGFLDFKEQDKALDIGCGGGATLKRMSERIREGHLTGVDYSPVSVKLSKEMNAGDVQSGKMEILEASVEHLPFADGTFDKIVTVESFYFWPNPAENLKEVLRILKAGGTFLLIADIYQKEHMAEETLENIKRYQLFNPTKEEFRALFEQAGFAETEIHTKDGEDWICVRGRRNE